ncbi:hypothetical protein K1719_013851 [Acacia pycnantha]|nr:hypothetical protein K1719_013851 [Acacia pycnantha]
MNGVDVSSWLLMEDSADSEADSGSFSLYHGTATIAGYDDDDAESCNYDTDGKYGVHEDDQNSGEFSCHEDNMDELDSQSSMIWQSDATSECFSALPVEDEQEKMKIEVDQKEMKIGGVKFRELEDRLFWETCMAVGYP